MLIRRFVYENLCKGHIIIIFIIVLYEMRSTTDDSPSCNSSVYCPGVWVGERIF